MAAPKKYPDELRERAVREVAESGRPIAHVARDLGIHPESLRQWVRQAETDRGEHPDQATSSEKQELARLRREVAELRRANEILKATSAYFAQELDRPPDELTAMIDEHKDRFGVEAICRVLGLSPSAYYARKARPTSARARRDQRLLVEIRRVHQASGGVYGARRVWRQLRREGFAVARCTVERLMCAHRIEGRDPRRETSHHHRGGAGRALVTGLGAAADRR